MRMRILLLTLSMLPALAAAQQIGYLERFALAEDRAAALAELTPGTDDYYFYHCLHYQNSGDAANYQKLMDAWVKRRGYTNQVKELQNRQAMLDYEKNPKGAFDRVRGELNLQFNHRQSGGRHRFIDTSECG